MRYFLLDIALPTIGSLLGVVLCIGLVVFETGVAIDIINNPFEMASDDAQ